MRQSRSIVWGIVLLVCVSLAGCVGDATKSASKPPAPSQIASMQGEPAPPAAPSRASEGTGGAAGTETGGAETVLPTIEGEPAPPAEATDIQERGVLPGLVAPSATLPGATLQIIAPTPSLTAIRNAIQVTSKSVSVNLRLPPNLPVTVPIEVSVAYISPAQAQRLTKTYSPASGLTILYREAEGDGKPRSMGMDITVRELIPNGQSFSVSKQLTIIPLYRAEISPLRFYMFTQCETVGKNDIILKWFYFNGKYAELKFDLGFGGTKMVNLFSSGRLEFSTQANLQEPTVQFYERDFVPARYESPIGRSGIPLVPGPTKEFSFILNEGATGPPASPSGSTGCKAQISYRIDRNVMTFDQF